MLELYFTLREIKKFKYAFVLFTNNLAEF